MHCQDCCEFHSVTVPDQIGKSLKTIVAPGEYVVTAAETDLTVSGDFGSEWLVLTTTRLLIWDAPTNPTPRLNLAVRDIARPRAEPLVGGGALQGTAGDEVTDFVRYTNSRQRVFERIARCLACVACAPEVECARTGPEETSVTEKPPEDGDASFAAGRPAGGNRETLARLLRYLLPYWKQSAALSLTLLSNSLLGLVSPFLTRPLMDIVLAPVGTPLPVSRRISWLGVIALGMFASQVAAQSLQVVQGRVTSWLTHQLGHNLRMQLYRKLQFLSLGYYARRQTGALMARVMQDTQALESALTNEAQHFAANLITLFGIAAVLCWIDWRLFVVALLPAPAVALLSRFTWHRIEMVWRRWSYVRERLSAMLNDSLSGVRVIRAFAQEQREIGRFGPCSEDLAQAGISAGRTWTMLFPAFTFITGLGSILVWYIGGRQVLSGGISLGTLMTFVAYLGMLYGPVQFFSGSMQWIGQAFVASERIFEVLDSEPDVREAPDALPMPHIEGRVEFRNVSFGYDSHRKVLRNVSIAVEPGEMIGLVGHSGAGKSSTINLICRFYDADEGRILIDGVDIRRIRQQDLRSRIGVVLQDSFLFGGSIAENIAYARPGASREEIMAAAKAANAHDFIVQKPDGYDTLVGEHGQMLSGGQRQRIAIARAILHDPRILILDEATSSVDVDTEKQIQNALARLVKGRTTFAIAHRLSTLRNADRLIVLKDGRIVESGTHDELLERKGEFARLVKLQQEISQACPGGTPH